MPYSFIGKHTPWTGTVQVRRIHTQYVTKSFHRPSHAHVHFVIQGLDHFTIALYGETEFYIFISANLHYYIEVEYASGSSYDDNAGNAHLKTLESGVDTPIDADFEFRFTQTSSSRIDAVLKWPADAMCDSICRDRSGALRIDI